MCCRLEEGAVGDVKEGALCTESAMRVDKCGIVFVYFFFNDTATTEIYTLSLHDALPICPFLVAAAPTLFILTHSRCGSAPAFYNAHFSLQQIGRAHV